jgi:SpoIVB peptidase S55
MRLIYNITLNLWLATALFSLAPGAALAARPPVPEAFPVESVRAGMTGVGLSVFEGTRVDSFPVTILGVLRGYRPGATLVLARAHGTFLERTGIIAGMSGSPVYIQGRLLGAIAYTWAFTKDPVAGITPIGEMLDLMPTEPVTSEVDERLGMADPPRDETSPPATGLYDPTGARPISTPLVLSGFTADAIRFLKPWMEDRGFVASPGGGSVPGMECDSIVPGSAVGVQLIRGDWSAAAIGTVTYRDKDRILAFGHPFVAMGWVRFPLTAATIHTVFASQQISAKVGSPSTPCGTLVADRSTGIYGEIGAQPSMIPVRVDITGTGKRSKHYRFEVARSRYLTPGLVGSTVVNSISEALNDVGFATLRYDLTYHMNGGATTIRKGNVILTQSPIAGVGDQVSQSLTVLLGEHFKPSTLDSASIAVHATTGLEAARISEVRVRPAMAAPGDSVEVEIMLRRGASDVETRQVRLRVPPETPEGELTVRVCDGEETDRWDRERTPERYKPETFDDVVRVFQEERRLDRLYVQLYRTAGGATVRGGEISQAPPSVLGVLGADRKSGAVAPTKGATLAERSIATEFVTRGCESAKLDVVPDRLR